MPIVIKHFTWSQTTSSVTITVPLNGAATHNTDVYSNDVYIKINFPPYFFDLDLYDSVDDQNAVAAVGNGCVKFTLPKIQHITWPDVRSVLTNPDDLSQRRAEACERVRKRIEENRAVKAKERREKESYLVQQQMDVERAGRARIAALKKAEQDAAAHELSAWKAEMTSNKTNSDHSSRATPLPTHDADSTGDLSNQESQRTRNATEETTRIGEEEVEKEVEEAEEEDDGESDEEVLAEALKAVAARKKILEQTKAITSLRPPPPRQSASIPVTFTERLIPHPAREGPDAERNARAIAAKKMGESMGSTSTIKKTSSADDDGMTFEERDPLLMKERGDRFYKAKDYKAALNAYSRALDLDGGKNVPTLSNRAATYLQLKEYTSCIADCTNAIEQLERHDEYMIQNMIPFPERGSPEERVLRECRIRLLVRRGTACGRQGFLKEGHEDYTAALSLDPRNSTLQKDVERMEALISDQNGGQSVGQ